MQQTKTNLSLTLDTQLNQFLSARKTKDFVLSIKSLKTRHGEWMNDEHSKYNFNGGDLDWNINLLGCHHTGFIYISSHEHNSLPQRGV